MIMAPVLFKAEDFDLLMRALAVAALLGGFFAVVLLVDLVGWWDRICWHRRRRARLARRRAKATRA